ncbi:hypothetical protein VTK56DRAFT_3570 [Thermocarpiscus australiensis]
MTMLRFGCAQIVIDRIDPLVDPGQISSPHIHQVVGGNAFNVTMPTEDVAKPRHPHLLCLILDVAAHRKVTPGLILQHGPADRRPVRAVEQPLAVLGGQADGLVPGAALEGILVEDADARVGEQAAEDEEVHVRLVVARVEVDGVEVGEAVEPVEEGFGMKGGFERFR